MCVVRCALLRCCVAAWAGARQAKDSTSNAAYEDPAAGKADGGYLSVGATGKPADA